VIRCDGNWEYNSKKFNAFCKENGIVKQAITPYTLKQNGVGERNN
jgi:transposase InsO family protein